MNTPTHIHVNFVNVKEVPQNRYFQAHFL